MNTMIASNANGIDFTVRLVDKGETYGRDFCLTHDEADPLVEFYDRRYPHTQYGQFVSRYYLSTLTGEGEHTFGPPHDGGLNLQGDVPDWSVDATAYSAVLAWLRAA